MCQNNLGHGKLIPSLKYTFILRYNNLPTNTNKMVSPLTSNGINVTILIINSSFYLQAKLDYKSAIKTLFNSFLLSLLLLDFF